MRFKRLPGRRAPGASGGGRSQRCSCGCLTRRATARATACATPATQPMQEHDRCRFSPVPLSTPAPSPPPLPQAIQFAVLDQFNQACVRRGVGGGRDPPLPFVGGAVAATVATVSSYPLDLLRTVMAAQGEPRVFNTMADAVRYQLQARGPMGLFAGLSATVRCFLGGSRQITPLIVSTQTTLATRLSGCRSQPSRLREGSVRAFWASRGERRLLLRLIERSAAERADSPRFA